MAGLYIHIPFCRTRCVYCGFYSTTCLSKTQRYVDALCKEVEMKAPPTAPEGASIVLSSAGVSDSPIGRTEAWCINTIYLGGGTPSQLTEGQLHQLFDVLYRHCQVADDAEVTIECNPDDITGEYASVLSRLPVNRVSMGAQTFNSRLLRFLHRRHTPDQVPRAVDYLRRAGIMNISVDLMYGFPAQTLAGWHADIDAALSLGVEHLSAYALTYEPGTPLYDMLVRGEFSEVDEEQSRQMYYDLKDRLESAGYEHYEISNFAKKGGEGSPSFRSRHNSSYWNHTPYVGLGAAAHSFSGTRRWWNVADVDEYMDAIEHDRLPTDGEQLDEDTLYNDLVMTRLRTCEGLDLQQLTPSQRSYCLTQAQSFLQGGLLRLENGCLMLTRDGLFVSDMVMSELMMA